VLGEVSQPLGADLRGDPVKQRIATRTNILPFVAFRDGPVGHCGKQRLHPLLLVLGAGREVLAHPSLDRVPLNEIDQPLATGEERQGRESDISELRNAIGSRLIGVGNGPTNGAGQKDQSRGAQPGEILAHSVCPLSTNTARRAACFRHSRLTENGPRTFSHEDSSAQTAA
jgi:hypothetical protein